jgi:hypothetical protein
MRDAIKTIRDNGGSNISVTTGRHARIHFTTQSGRRETILMTNGCRVSTRNQAAVRVAVRRLMH